jgi:hypothetical protein
LDDFKDFGDDIEDGDSLNCAQIVTLGNLGWWHPDECSDLLVELAATKCCGYADGSTTGMMAPNGKDFVQLFFRCRGKGKFVRQECLLYLMTYLLCPLRRCHDGQVAVFVEIMLVGLHHLLSHCACCEVGRPSLVL